VYYGVTRVTLPTTIAAVVFAVLVLTVWFVMSRRK